VEISHDCLEYLLLNGLVTVIIDGVDEIADLATRRRFIPHRISFLRARR